MNEVMLIVNDGDGLDDLISTALKIVKIPSVRYCVFKLNDVKLFVLKNSKRKNLTDEYFKKLK